MRYTALLLVIAVNMPLWAITPEVKTPVFQVSKTKCPSDKRCSEPRKSYCNRGNVEISPNNDGSFDLIFNNFLVSTDEDSNFSSASCTIQVPVGIPPNKRINLKEVSVSGITIIGNKGRSTASITRFFQGGKSKSTRSFNKTKAFVVSHSQKTKQQASDCGQGEVLVGARIDITAAKTSWSSGETFVNLSSGSGQLKYQLDYQDCNPEPEPCGPNQHELKGVCYNLVDLCSIYRRIIGRVCRNSDHDFIRHQDVRSRLCHLCRNVVPTMHK